MSNFTRAIAQIKQPRQGQSWNWNLFFDGNHMNINSSVEWMSSQTPRRMLDMLKEPGNSGLLRRELRLFSCACCRHAGDFLYDERSWEAVEVGERYADGEVSHNDLKAAFDRADMVVDSILQRIMQINLAGRIVTTDDVESEGLYEFDDWHVEGRRLHAARSARACVDNKLLIGDFVSKSKYRGDWVHARAASLLSYLAGASRDWLEWSQTAFLAGRKDFRMYEDAWQADLVRCLFRNPDWPMVVGPLQVEPQIRDIAESIYRLRAFDRMADLGKELEATGRVDPELVAHCIDSPTHSRGCWALDMVRGFKRHY